MRAQKPTAREPIAFQTYRIDRVQTLPLQNPTNPSNTLVRARAHTTLGGRLKSRKSSDCDFRVRYFSQFRTTHLKRASAVPASPCTPLPTIVQPMRAQHTASKVSQRLIVCPAVLLLQTETGDLLHEDQCRRRRRTSWSNNFTHQIGLVASLRAHRAHFACFSRSKRRPSASTIWG